jgi:hypothetical protein
MVAEIPQKKVAVPIQRYPRTGCSLLGKNLVQTLPIETHYHFLIHDDGGRGAAAIFINQILHGCRIAADIPIFVLYASRREVGPDGVARRSAGLGKDHDLLGHRSLDTTSINEPRYFSTYSIATDIFAVFCSIAATEQYFSSESRTASSTALRETAPPTVYVN